MKETIRIQDKSKKIIKKKIEKLPTKTVEKLAKIKEAKKRQDSKRKNNLKLHVYNVPTYQPLEIICMAHKNDFIAVGRSDSSIEIWNIKSWSNLLRIPLQQNDKIQTMSFLHSELNFRLIVGCLNGELMEFNLTSILPVRKVMCTGQAIWDIAIQNGVQTTEQRFLVAGEDGIIRIYQYQSDDDSKYFLEKQTRNYDKARCLSVDWDNDNQHFYGSFSNGLIQKYDRIMNNVLTININENANKQKNFAWKIKILSENLIAVGCNNGYLKIFETIYGTQIKSLKTHEADILQIIHQNGSLYISGSDSKIVHVQYINSNWIVSSQDRGQSHDVRALILLDNKLISGGMTTDLCIYKLSEDMTLDERKQINSDGTIKTKKLRHITALPQFQFQQIINLNKSCKLIMMQKSNSIELWEIQLDSQQSNFLIEIQTNNNPILCSSINHNATMLAYSTLEGTNIFVINGDLKLEKVQVLKPSTVMIFSDDSPELFYVDIDNKFSCYDLLNEKNRVISNLKQKYAVFNFIQNSINGQYLAIGSKFINTILVFDLQTEKLHYEIPKIMVAGFMNFKFCRNCKYLYVVYDNNKFSGFNLKKCKMSGWSVRNLNKFPKDFMNKHNKLIGIDFNPLDEKKIILWSHFYYIIINQDSEIPQSCRILKSNQTQEKQNFDIVYRNQPILSFDSDKNGFQLIQNSWSNMLKTMPDAINAKKYGF